MKVRKIIVIFSTLISYLSLSGQTEIKNGVVIDKGAIKIVNSIASQIKKDSPLSFSFTYQIEENNERQQGKGIFLGDNTKYTITTEKFSYFCNGKTVWNYIKQSNEVEIMDIEDGNSIFNFVKIINNSIKNFRPKSIRKEIFNKVHCNIVDLIPTQKGSISKIRIYSSVNNNRLQRIEINTYSGSKYHYTFTNYITKKNVSNKDFTFDKSKFPKVKVVDLR